MTQLLEFNIDVSFVNSQNIVKDFQGFVYEIEHCQYYAPDDDLKTLKKKKLRLKDEIEQLKNHLNNLTK